MEVAIICAIFIALALWLFGIILYTSKPLKREGLKLFDRTLSDRKGQKVAVVTMMRDPKDIDEWLNYHLLKGVSRFYIRLETVDQNDPIAHLLRTYPQVTLVVGDPGVTPASGERDLPGQAQMLRQRSWVDASIKNALKDGVDWIIHIDSDELLECDGEVCDAIQSDASADTHTMVMKNFEAVYDPNKVSMREKQGCFFYNSVKDCGVGECASYANGKGVGRVSKNLREAGVHRFRYVGGGTDDQKNMRSLRIIHFESCDFAQYMDKFMKLSKSENLAFPFPYYNESIAVAKKDVCKRDSSDKNCIDAFATVYKKYRTVEGLEAFH